MRVLASGRSDNVLALVPGDGGGKPARAADQIRAIELLLAYGSRNERA